LTPWRKFIAIHMNVMVATDFFCKTVWTPLGKHVAYVLAFIHLGSRKVFLSPSTLNPTDEWMQQQARNASMWADEEGIDLRFLIHDRDCKFAEAFDEYFRRKDGGPVLTPYGAPIANCFAESWIGSLKRECLNHFFCFSLGHLDHILTQFARFHYCASYCFTTPCACEFKSKLIATMSRAPSAAGFHLGEALSNPQFVQLAAPEQPGAVVQRVDARDGTTLGSQAQRLRTDPHVNRGFAQRQPAVGGPLPFIVSRDVMMAA
jgi:hypothetical protein